MEEEVTGGSDNIVTEYNTYEDFLDSQINDVDLFYLEVSFVYILLSKIAWPAELTLTVTLTQRA